MHATACSLKSDDQGFWRKQWDNIVISYPLLLSLKISHPDYQQDSASDTTSSIVLREWHFVLLVDGVRHGCPWSDDILCMHKVNHLLTLVPAVIRVQEVSYILHPFLWIHLSGLGRHHSMTLHPACGQRPQLIYHLHVVNRVVYSHLHQRPSENIGCLVDHRWCIVRRRA